MVLNGTIRLKCLEGNANRIPGVLNDLKGGIKGFKMLWNGLKYTAVFFP